MAPTLNQPREHPSPMLPTVVRVQAFQAETHDTFTLGLAPPTALGTPYSFLPGQFNMLYGFGLGEVPISMSGDPAEAGVVVHTIRAVGSVTRGLARLRPGSSIGIRGPFGSSWPLDWTSSTMANSANRAGRPTCSSVSADSRFAEMS